MRYPVILFLLLSLIGCNNKEYKVKNYADIEHVKSQMNKLAPVEIDFDHTILPENEMAALKKIVQASRYMDKIFLRQVYAGNEKLEKELQSGTNPDYKILYDYFKINFGPFDRLEHDKPFINLKEEKPAGANYYPEDMSKKEFENFLKLHPELQESFENEYTLIRREGKELKAVPYSEAYAEYLKPAADLLKEAASLTANPSLKKYLNSRADAFLSNDYFESDMNWVDLKDHLIEVVIGPYEVYEDNLFGYKAAFESFVTIVDPVESKKLATVSKYLDDMESHLPIPRKYMNFNRGKSSPILVVQEVYTAGDTKAAIQTTAFNLPNDERVREAKGSKKVMLKNIARAKFEKCWIPIVNEVLDEKDLPHISFDAYFNHVLMHEMSHGLGPGNIVKYGKQTSVSRELKELYSTIEEGKADILGVYNLQYMIDKGVFPKKLEESIYVSFLGGIFRSVRFGIGEAHGGANIIALNYLLDKGGFYYDDQKVRFGVNHEKIKQAVKELAHELLMIQAHGDYERAAKFIEKYRYIPESLSKALQKVEHVPVDIKPVYVIEKEL